MKTYSHIGIHVGRGVTTTTDTVVVVTLFRVVTMLQNVPSPAAALPSVVQCDVVAAVGVSLP